MHVVAVTGSPCDYFHQSEVIGTCLTDEEMVSLSTYLAGSFALDPHGRLISRKQGIYGDSQFYDGVGRYYMLNTCNKWTAKGLQSGGLAIDPVFSLTAESVMNGMKAHRQQCPVDPLDCR